MTVHEDYDRMPGPDRARLTIERWPTPCGFCGSRYGWVLNVDDWPVQQGCVRSNSVADMIRMARLELARRSA